MISDYKISGPTGTVFDIQGLSVHDGPGCRTLVFLSGCTLNCFWCSNPEGISLQPSLLHFSSKCIRCGKCIENCPEDALCLEDEDLRISRQHCVECSQYRCLAECYTEALRMSSYEISVSALYDIIRRDRQFWGKEGGITLTGGEPLVQNEFASAILKKCYEGYIHTAVETCGNVPWHNFESVLPYLDWIFFDLKQMNTTLHKEATRTDNTLILENARRLSASFSGRLIFRLPLIPGFNDSTENLEETISFLHEIGRSEINVLPLHHLGREKYPLLSQVYTGMRYPVPTPEQMSEIKQKLTNAGIRCYVGYETPF